MATLQDIKEQAAGHGIAFTRKEIEAIQGAYDLSLQHALQAQADSDSDNSTNSAGRVSAFIGLMQVLGNAGMTVAQSVIVNLGVPLLLVVLVVVEHGRVLHGVLLFEQDYALATLTAWALVLLNLVLEFNVHYVEKKAGYHATRALAWSLRIWLANTAYRLGIGDTWVARELSPAHAQRGLLSAVTIAILCLATAGSMAGAIAGVGGAWYSAIVAIATQSTLANMTVWLGGLVTSWVLVLAVQRLASYVAQLVADVALQYDLSAQHADSLQRAHHAHAQAHAQADTDAAYQAQAILQARLQAQADKATKRRQAATDTAMPDIDGSNGQTDFLVVTASNGNGATNGATNGAAYLHP